MTYNPFVTVFLNAKQSNCFFNVAGLENVLVQCSYVITAL